MPAEISFVRLILDASFIVQIVLVLLLLASIASWVVIFEKRRTLRKATETADRFESEFWSGTDLNRMHQGISNRSGSQVGIEKIFASGFREYERSQGQPGNVLTHRMESVRRAMRVAEVKGIDDLEHNLAFLATVGSTSPYVGLFGTVWGIMNAFRALGNVQQATLAMVAPGIAEALVATAMGLFAAIPAVIAYNRYADKVDRLESRYTAFIEEFSSILERHERAAGGSG